MVVRGNLGEPQIDFTLTDDGAKRFADVTRNNIGRAAWPSFWTASLYSAPNIQRARLKPATARSPGHFTAEEAQELANVLQNPLRAPLEH